ncbi:MAG: GntR family transcriptional regulator, partial [Terriglobales bacterium]
MELALPLQPSPPAPPLHRQLYRFLQEGILAGHWTPGEPVPSTRELARSLGVARGTVTRAYDDLLAEGYLQSQTGARTRISPQLPERLLPLPVKAAPTAATLRLSRWGAAVATLATSPPAPGLGAGPDLAAFPRQAWA